MDSALTRPQSLQELYKTYFAFANKFQFTTLLRNYIQNEEWKDKSQEPVWNILSKISDDIGAVLTDNIVNYTRNVVDINTCKVPQFIEQGKMLSYNLEHLKKSYDFLPKRIQCLVDIFSVNPEFLIGNHNNHILSDQVIKEILVYIKENGSAKVAFTNEDVVDRLIDDPHGLTDAQTYRNFILALFYTSIVEALSVPYSNENKQPIVFNLLWQERQNQRNIISHLKEYKTWLDRYISNEIEHPLNDGDLRNTIYADVERIKNQKNISTKFNPFKIADDIYFNGLNPTNKLSEDELSLVEMVVNYHARTKYNYESQEFDSDQSTQYAYYKELEFCEYVKMVMYVMNNINNFQNLNLNNLSYDPASNKFIQVGTDGNNCLRIVQLFCDGEHLVDDGQGNVVIDKKNIVFKVAKFLCDYVFSIQFMRENIKTIATKHAMRGTAGLLVHIVNDYLIKELPLTKEHIMEDAPAGLEFQFGWESQPDKFKNYGNVNVIEYEDDNEYFNIDPENDVRFTQRTNARYWEKLQGMEDDDKLGVLTKSQIRDFYRDTLGMGRLQPRKPKNYDDICEFLVDLFKIGANPISYNGGELHNPVDDMIYDSEEKYGYTRQERMEVQTNTELRKNQERQFMEYSGDEELVGNSIYEFVNNRLFYWKNQDYSSHVLHPFMYNLKLWNRLNNIIVNGYKNYMDSDLVEHMSSKVKFDELVGEFGECNNFWKYNVTDCTGYTTRYEATIKDEHKDDENRTTSPLTGYDGLFYPDAAQDFLRIFWGEARDKQMDKFQIPGWFFINPNELYKQQKLDLLECFKSHQFICAIHSIYWQLSEDIDNFVIDNQKESPTYGESLTYKVSKFYLKWYSHLNYTRAEYQKIAMQLWYWRRRIVELIRNNYDISKYCLDVQGNSLILMKTFKLGDDESNPYLIDLSIAQNKLLDEASGNLNTHVPFCENKLVKPNEMWVKWKSNPIALPAFDVNWQEKTGDAEFDYRFRTDENQEMGQLTHSNNDCNDDFHVVVREWLDQYKNMIQWKDANGNKLDDNRLPVFFDMEQSANVLALASWRCFNFKDKDGIEHRDENGEPVKAVLCGKNPLHILSIERTSTSTLEYNWTKYTDVQYPLFDVVNLTGWLFDAYHYCPANGSLLIPLYKFDCVEGASGTRDVIQPKQIAKVDMFLVPAQMLKQENFAVTDRIYRLPIDIDLNHIVDFGDDWRKFRFDHPIKVCRNTNMVFSPYDCNGQNKVKCAFLGVFMDSGEQPYGEDENNYDIKSIKFSSCGAATRYEYDSQSALDLGLVKNEYHKGDDVHWGAYSDGDVESSNKVSKLNRLYIDKHISKESFNSYDSNDKYVFIVDFQTSVDNNSLFLNTKDNIMSYSYNILSDAGYIPHFVYQSLLKYNEGDSVDGTAYTWRNKYLKTKKHLSFELLGLDDKEIPEAFKTMEKMVVEDTTDGCKTLVNPAKLMDDIYRVWCETKGGKRTLPSGQEDKYGYKAKYDSYFENEYKDYANPKIEKLVDGYEWDVCKDHPEDRFEISLAQSNGGIPDNSVEKFKSILDEYYVSILRTDNGQFLNEKRYILPPTKLSEFILELSDDPDKARDTSKIDGYVDCNLGEYQSPSIDGDHYVPEQVIFTGTQNPFRYDKDGNKIYSRAETLQYGNGILGLDGIKLKVVVESEVGHEPKRDVHGNVISTEKVVKVNGVSKIVVEPETVEVNRKFLRPYVKFVKSTRNSTNLLDRLHNETNVIEEGQITVVLSHKNLDNIAKYHILNTSSNLYYNGSLSKDGTERFKYADFKFKRTLVLVEDEEQPNSWYSKLHVVEVHDSSGQSLGYVHEFNFNGIELVDKREEALELEKKELEELVEKTRKLEQYIDCTFDISPILSFSAEDVKGYKFVDNIGSHIVPPYYISDKDGNPLWFLEQDKLVPSPSQEAWDEAASKWSQDQKDLKNIGHTLDRGEQVPIKNRVDSEVEYQYGIGFRENGMTYPIPTTGNFKWAHLVKSRPEKYLDYLYVKRGRLSFKISEESESFGEAMSMIPPFYIDEATKNKIQDLNDVQILKEYSTFIHQSEEPRLVEECPNFNPYSADVVLKYGVEQKEIHNSDEVIDEETGEVTVIPKPDDHTPIVICTDESTPRLIELSNLTDKTRLDLQFENGEVDDYLKIYTNYVRVEDGHGDFHYDLYFNIQNLFNSPFEYISSVTKQANVLILQDSYLYLTGDKYTNKGDHNEVDDEKMKSIKEGGELSIYGQVKVYSDGMLSDTKTIKLFTYKVYNVSDDKPKFLIEKVYDVTKATLQTKISRKIEIAFSDVLWQIDENQFEFLDGDKDKFRVLNQDVYVVQPIHVKCDWDAEDDFRTREISFDISNDIIDFGAVPELCGYDFQVRTLRNQIMGNQDKIWREPHYDHWSDRNMHLEVNPTTNMPRLTLTFQDGGYNFETIYLRWKLPRGCRIMDSIDRLRGYVFSSTASDVVVDCGNPMAAPEVETTLGHVVVRVKKVNEMHIGLEHSTTKRMNGYVILNLASEIKNALLRGDFNPTFDSARVVD